MTLFGLILIVVVGIYDFVNELRKYEIKRDWDMGAESILIISIAGFFLLLDFILFVCYLIIKRTNKIEIWLKKRF